MNRKMHNQGVRFVLACLLLVFGIAWASPAQADVTYSGQAFGAYVNVNLLGLIVGPKTLADTGPLPPSGGMQTNQLADVSEPGVLSVAIMPTMTSGANGVARSAASLADVVVLPVLGQSPLLTASIVRAESEATCNGVLGATEVVDLKVAGQDVTVLPFAPNQNVGPITVAGVGDVTLVINEQKTSSGGGTQDITVNAVHLTVTVSGLLAAEVILSSAHSDVQGCPGCPPNPPCADFVTGGGWINSPVGNSKANFGFNAGYKPNATTPEIHFNYIDHYTGMHMKATSISMYAVGATPTTRHMEGIAEIDGVPGFTYSIDVADNGEPGQNTDTLYISLSNGYKAGGALGGGNIQLHKPCP